MTGIIELAQSFAAQSPQRIGVRVLKKAATDPGTTNAHAIEKARQLGQCVATLLNQAIAATFSGWQSALSLRFPTRCC